MVSVILLVVLLSTLCGLHAEEEDSGAKVEYDFIVVGVGAAGSVIASRLAEAQNLRFKVLGIEAGGRTHRSLNGTDYVASSFYTDPVDGSLKIGIPYTRFDVPAFYPTTSVPPTPYEVWPLIRNGNPFFSNAGRLLGGSGAHNGMLFVRFTKANFDSWGVHGWRYDDVLPFYKKLENVTGTVSAINPAYHGFDGPIKISDVPTTGFFQSIPIWIQACVNLGLPRNIDFNGPTREGCGSQVFNVRRGVRDSSANAMLSYAARKGNLFLELHAHVTKLIIEERNGKPRAVGVEFVQFGVTKRVYAKREIIISGGALNTPRILQLSGIGPKALLRSLGIKVWVANDNVGQHLGNNQLATSGWSYPNISNPNSFLVSTTSVEYAVNGTGVWAFPPNLAFAYACINNGTCDDPDVMIGSAYDNIPNGGLGNKVLELYVEPAVPQSRGVLGIKTTNPFDPIYITMDTFQAESDLNATIFGLQVLRRMRATYPASAYFTSEILPGPTVQTYQDYVNYVNTTGHLVAHWVGTARMGNAGDPTRVVDPKLRVVGIDGLRVGDTSVVVRCSSHTHATALMIGERTAHFVLEAVLAEDNALKMQS